MSTTSAGAVSLSLGVLDRERIARLREGIRGAAAAGARAVVLSGGHEEWCTGLDLAGAARGEPVDVSDLRELLLEIDRVPAIVIALVDGKALGGGVGICAACDLVIAGEGASFGLPEAIMGVIPAVVFPYVARRIGVARARGLALTARTLSATEAASFGLVDEVAGDPDESLRRTLRRMERLDARAVAAMKALVASHFGPTPTYGEDAVARFSQLLASDATRARIDRFNAGLAPWEDAAPDGEA